MRAFAGGTSLMVWPRPRLMTATSENLSFPVEVLCRLGFYNQTNKLFHALGFMVVACHDSIHAGGPALGANALSKFQDFGPLVSREGAFALRDKKLILRRKA